MIQLFYQIAFELAFLFLLFWRLTIFFILVVNLSNYERNVYFPKWTYAISAIIWKAMSGTPFMHHLINAILFFQRGKAIGQIWKNVWNIIDRCRCSSQYPSYFRAGDRPWSYQIVLQWILGLLFFDNVM